MNGTTRTRVIVLGADQSVIAIFRRSYRLKLRRSFDTLMAIRTLFVLSHFAKQPPLLIIPKKHRLFWMPQSTLKREETGNARV